MSERRIAAIQHGDYAEALRIIGRGDSEPYFAMGYSLRVLQDLFADSPHLVVSLNAPLTRESHGAGEFVGLPLSRPSLPLTGILALTRWARQIVRELERFKPTHVLLRTGGMPAWQVLRYCIRHDISTLVVLAERFDDSHSYDRFINRRLAHCLNHRCVTLVGNHKQPATDSMVKCGIEPAKAIAWDWPNTRHPNDWPVKRPLRGGQPRIAFVGVTSMAKGLGDLIEAVRLLHADNFTVHLTAVGEGPDLEALRAIGSTLPPGMVDLPGRVTNDRAFQLMLESTLVCVPSRHEFAEGMPLTLTEALASRTPTVISDHPVLAGAFVEGEGVRFFPEKNAAALAKIIREVCGDPGQYERLSQSTAEAFRRVECRTAFGDLIERWKATF